MNTSMRKLHPIWYIAGVGAIGGVLAGYFCRAGHSVHLILKNQEQLNAYHAARLTINQDEEHYTCFPPATELDALDTQPIDYFICSTKAYDVMPLLMRLRHRLHEKSLVILTHNGLGVLDEIQNQLPHLRVMFGVVKWGAYLEKPFTIRAILHEKLYLGVARGEFTTQEIETVCQAFSQTQLPYRWEKDIHAMMWEKFALNCCMNVLTALLDCTNGGLLAHKTKLEELAGEVAHVLSAYERPISTAELLKRLIQLLQNTADNYSSMYQDAHHGKPTELPYLNGYLVQLARKKNITTPVNDGLLTEFRNKFPRL